MKHKSGLTLALSPLSQMTFSWPLTNKSTTSLQRRKPNDNKSFEIWNQRPQDQIIIALHLLPMTILRSVTISYTHTFRYFTEGFGLFLDAYVHVCIKSDIWQKVVIT